MPRIVGIDLGTTNSLVAIVENGAPRVIPGPDGSNLVPSVVYFEDRRKLLVGNAAREKMIEKPEEHHLLDQAIHGQRPRGRPQRSFSASF